MVYTAGRWRTAVVANGGEWWLASAGAVTAKKPDRGGHGRCSARERGGRSDEGQRQRTRAVVECVGVGVGGVRRRALVRQWIQRRVGGRGWLASAGAVKVLINSGSGCGRFWVVAVAMA